MGAKLKAAAVLFVMFGLGVVSGIAWEMHSGHRGHMPFGHPERRITRMKKELSLSPGQEQSVRDILLKAQQRAQGVQQNVALSMAQIHKETIDAIDKVLTAEQRPQFEKMRQRHHRHHPGTEPETAKALPEPTKPDVK